MFLETIPIRKFRKCLHCPRYFDSSSAAERVCPKCRRKHNKLIEKHGGVITFESTPQMAAHLAHITEIEDQKLSSMTPEKINAFLDGSADVDDSAVYNLVKQEETTTTVPAKPRAVVILLTLLSKEDTNVPAKRKPKPFYW